MSYTSKRIILTFLFHVIFGLSCLKGTNADTNGTDCASSQFTCKSGSCVPTSWRCDGDPDCTDGSDEDNCPTTTCASQGEFRCNNGKCIAEAYVCDGEDDCHDKSDEELPRCRKSSCGINEYRCLDGTSVMCIPTTWQCDGREDCSNGDDEKDCDKCALGDFTCANGKCISEHWTCDQANDCDDNSDEDPTMCGNVTCNANEFMCGDQKTCLVMKYKCDGDEDCRDGSDEEGCEISMDSSYCSSTEFQCESDQTECVHSSWKCDGVDDCMDGSDEKGCVHTCRPDQITCQDDKRCISQMYECDGHNDCADGSDELNCDLTANVCSADEFDCNGNGIVCIKKDQVCDGFNDCGNWNDESVHPKVCRENNPCNLENGNCSQICINKYKSASCKCRVGYRLQEDRKSCDDIDECELPGTCSQTCTNTKGGFKCTCSEGYELEDHTFCKAIERPWLLFTNRKDIRKISLDSKHLVPVTHDLDEVESVVALDYHYENKHIYWSDNKQRKILSGVLAPNGSVHDIKAIVVNDISIPDGISVDWIHNLLFWTDTGKDTIEVMSLENNFRHVLVDNELDEPRAIVVDPINGWIYWSDWGEIPKIEKVGMNGLHRKTIVEHTDYNTVIQWPNGLTLDFVSNRLYWIDAKLHMIASCDSDGRHTRIIKSDPYLIQHPFAITVFEDNVYWTDWESRSIKALDKFNGKTNSTIALELDTPMDIHIYHPQRQPSGINRCGQDNGRCPQLCLPAPYIHQASPKYTCTEAINNVPGTTTTLKVTSEKVTTAKSVINNVDITTESPTIAPYDHITPDSNTTEKLTDNDFENLSVGMTTATIVGIAVGVLLFSMFVLAVAGVVVYKRYNRLNTKRMNFDNPVYRKTTEADSVSLGKDSIPSTLQPLTQSVENEYV